MLAGSSLASMALSGLSTETTNQMSKYITDNKDTLVKIGDIAKKVNGADISDISGIGKLITSVTGDSTLFSINDKDGISGICSSIVSECSKFGVPNVLTELSSNKDSLANLITDGMMTHGVVADMENPKNFRHFVFTTATG